VIALTAPIIPGLNDHEVPALLAAAAKAGARDAGYVLVRLPHAVAPLFEAWLERHVPGQKEKVLGRLRELHGGKLYDATFGKRMTGEGPLAEQLKAWFEISKRRAGFAAEREGSRELSTAAFRVPTAQLMLW
jgi:DNA repair photolyase